MSIKSEILKFKSLNLSQIRDKVKEIRMELPQERRTTITYSKNFTLSLSNYCQNQCSYCFYNYRIPKVGGEDNVIILGNEQMETIIQKGLRHNCKEALIVSGERPDSFPEVNAELKRRNCHDFVQFIKDICTYLLDFNLLPHTNIGVLNHEELKELKPFNASMGLMLESSNSHLRKRGGVHEFSPGKEPKVRIKHIKNAGKLRIPFTTGLLLGIGENFEDRVKDLFLIKELNDKYGHIQEVIIQNFVYKPGIAYKPKSPVSIEEMLKITGIARIIFQNEISIQVPPNLIQGHESEFIPMGIDDFGGVSPFTIDYINPEKNWPQIDHLNEICQNNGFRLKERFPIYDSFIEKPDFCPETIKKRIDNITLDA